MTYSLNVVSLALSLCFLFIFLLLQLGVSNRLGNFFFYCESFRGWGNGKDYYGCEVTFEFKREPEKHNGATFFIHLSE
jgi:hypothetical protein